MRMRLDHAEEAAGSALEQRSALLDVWLELLEKIEGPKRRRVAESRRRRDNPMRRAPNRNAQVRSFGRSSAS
jgi:hypothetical protein